MGVEPFLLSSALAGEVAQRLVRAVCPTCRTTYAAPASAVTPYGIAAEGQLRLTRGRGCGACFDSGYKDRLGIHEVLEIEGDLQRLIIGSPSRDALDAYLEAKGVRTLIRDGVERAMEGRTTVEEVLRAVNS